MNGRWFDKMFQNYSPQTKLNMSSAHTVIAQTLCSSLVNNVITWKLLNMTLLYSTPKRSGSWAAPRQTRCSCSIGSWRPRRRLPMDSCLRWILFQNPSSGGQSTSKAENEIDLKVLPANLLHSELAPRLAQYASLPSSALQFSKVGRTRIKVIFLSWLWALLCRGAFRYFHPIHPSTPPYIAFSSLLVV